MDDVDDAREMYAVNGAVESWLMRAARAYDLAGANSDEGGYLPLAVSKLVSWLEESEDATPGRHVGPRGAYDVPEMPDWAEYAASCGYGVSLSCPQARVVVDPRTAFDGHEDDVEELDGKGVTDLDLAGDAADEMARALRDGYGWDHADDAISEVIDRAREQAIGPTPAATPNLEEEWDKWFWHVLAGEVSKANFSGLDVFSEAETEAMVEDIRQAHASGRSCREQARADVTRIMRWKGKSTWPGFVPEDSLPTGCLDEVLSTELPSPGASSVITSVRMAKGEPRTTVTAMGVRSRGAAL